MPSNVPAHCECELGAGSGPTGGGPEEGILDVVIIGGHYVQVLANSISRTGPHDLQSLVAKTVHAVSRIAMFVLLNAAQPPQIKSPAMSVKGVCGSLGAVKRIHS